MFKRQMMGFDPVTFKLPIQYLNHAVIIIVVQEKHFCSSHKIKQIKTQDLLACGEVNTRSVLTGRWKDVRGSVWCGLESRPWGKTPQPESTCWTGSNCRVCESKQAHRLEHKHSSHTDCGWWRPADTCRRGGNETGRGCCGWVFWTGAASTGVGCFFSLPGPETAHSLSRSGHTDQNSLATQWGRVGYDGKG